MPFYDFECIRSKEVFTVRHGYDEPHPTACPTCGCSIRLIYYPAATIFKGNGFFSTDNKGDGRVRGESGAMGRLVSETDISNIDEETPTRIGDRGRPKMTPTRPLPARIKQQLKARKIIDEKQPDGMTKRTHIF